VRTFAPAHRVVWKLIARMKSRRSSYRQQ
jgi:hypothetical protein